MSHEEYRSRREMMREMEALRRELASMREDLSAVTHSKPWRLYMFGAHAFHFLLRFLSFRGARENVRQILVRLKHVINRHPAWKRLVMRALGHFPRLEYRLKRLGHMQPSADGYVPFFSPDAEDMYFRLKEGNGGEDIHESAH